MGKISATLWVVGTGMILTVIYGEIGLNAVLYVGGTLCLIGGIIAKSEGK
jgi:hypothetical protein